jgi:hypothetical protein
MPGIAPKGSTDLICEDLYIQRHRLSLSTRSAELLISLTDLSSPNIAARATYHGRSELLDGEKADLGGTTDRNEAAVRFRGYSLRVPVAASRPYSPDRRR